MYRFKTIALIICLLLLSVSAVSAADIQFKDVPANHWAYEAIQNLCKAGVISGYPDKTFRPGKQVTREQFAVIIVKALRIPTNKRAPQNYSDIPTNHRSFIYIDAIRPYIPLPAKQTKFNFNPNAPITREDAAATIALALDLGKNQKVDEKFLSERFTDYQTISTSLRQQVALAVYNNIMSGNAKGEFRPKGSLTRAELCVITNKFLPKTTSTSQINIIPVGAPMTSEPGSAALVNTLPPVHKPWTIEFDYKQPEWNEVKSFYGQVISAVYNPTDSYLKVQHCFYDEYMARETKTVTVYVYRNDLNNFSIGDWVRFDYDYKNNVISYTFEYKVKTQAAIDDRRYLQTRKSAS